MDTQHPDPREARLPLWARALINNLRREAKHAQTAAAEARYATDPDGSDAVLHPHDDIPVGLGRDVRVRFLLGSSGRYVDVYNGPDNAYLVLSAGGRMSLLPQSTNLLHFETERAWGR